jgi:DNA-binding LytR/AlgR family response regulator
MKYTIVIDPEREEEILIYAKSRSPLVERIEELIRESDVSLVAYCGDEIVTLSASEVECFFMESGKLYAMAKGKKFLLKQRLYAIEEITGSDFLKMNQSCIVNVNAIERFETKLGGALMVKMRCGYVDYVSRRQMKTVKNKIGM